MTTTSGHARVAYHITVNGREYTASGETSTTGIAAQAALGLLHASSEDAKDALRAARSKETPGQALLRRVKTIVRTRTVTVFATVEIDGNVHEHHGEARTSGDPYRAGIAATNTAREDLWDWAWEKCKAEANAR